MSTDTVSAAPNPLPSSSTANPTVSSTATATVSSSSQAGSFRPTDFKMGKFMESYPGKGDWYAVSGGIPDHDWMHIVTPRQFNPNQCRPLDKYQQSKMMDKRSKGLDEKFKAGDNLTLFKNNLVEYFIMHGLDTITYLPDLSSYDDTASPSRKMFSVVEHYSRFCVNPEKTKEIANIYSLMKYDEFDKLNSDTAKLALFNSIEASILKRLKSSLKMEDSFVVAWLTFLELQLSTSSKHYDDLRKVLREIDVRKYPMQNIADMCAAIDPIVKELDNANQYQPSLTLSLLQRVRSTCTQNLQFPVKIDLKLRKQSRMYHSCLLRMQMLKCIFSNWTLNQSSSS